MDRLSLTDAQWAKMERHCLGKPGDRGRTGADNRLFVEAVLWIVRTGSPWRDLPPWFGKWNTVFKRFRDWVKADMFQRLFVSGVPRPWPSRLDAQPPFGVAQHQGMSSSMRLFGQPPTSRVSNSAR